MLVISTADEVDDDDVQQNGSRFSGLRARVCIGLSVRNAQQFLTDAVESVLAQRFGDLELIIADNASADATSDLCLDFAKTDKRISYVRHSTAVSDRANLNRTYELSGGQYFMWMRADEELTPDFLQTTVAALDADPSAALAFSHANCIDSTGSSKPAPCSSLATDANLPHIRFRAIACAPPRAQLELHLTGLMRRASVDRIPLPRDHAGWARVFLARLAMYGSFIEIPCSLRTIHERRRSISRVLPTSLQRRQPWFARLLKQDRISPAAGIDVYNPDASTFGEWRLLWEYVQSVRYGWLNTRQRAECVSAVLQRQLSYGNWMQLFRDLAQANDCRRFAMSKPTSIESVRGRAPTPAPTKAAA